MRRFVFSTALFLGVAWAAGPVKPIPPVKFTDTRLDNGLRVIISEDHQAPVYAIVVTYSVGSKDERPGRTGFAHLFEHMMFKGSENVGNGEHFYLVYNNGGEMNGTTNNDRTEYYETLPKNQLDLGLFLESDRMRALAVTKDNLENQRQAVKEERRLRVDNQAYGKSNEILEELPYDNFAYKHSVIGSMEDLDAASVDDVKAFFKTYYAPNNATLVLVGDLDTKATLEKVKKYFGSIPRQEPPRGVDLAEKTQTAERRQQVEDPLARLSLIDMVYKIPPGNSPDVDALSVLHTILAGGESSRLYQKLVKDKEISAQAGGGLDARIGPGLYEIYAVVAPGKTVAEVQAALDEEITRIQNEPVSASELERARTSARVASVSQGSVMSRARSLATAAVMYNDPGRINTIEQRRTTVTAQKIQEVAKKYLDKNNRTVVVTVPAPPKAPAR